MTEHRFQAIGAGLLRNRKLLVSSMSSLGLRLVGLGGTFALGVVLARLLGPAEYGAYGFIIALAALAMNLSLLGTPQLAVREMAVHSARQNWDGARTLGWTLIAATTAASLLVGLIAVAIALIFFRAQPHVLPLALLGAGLSALLTITTITAAELRGLGEMAKGQFMDIVGRPVAALILTGGMLLAGAKLGALSALSIQFGVAAVAALISLVWVKATLSKGIVGDGKTPWRAERGWLRQAVPLGIVDVLRQFDGTYGLIMMGFISSASELGVYRVAVASSVLVNMPITILHVVVAPIVSRHYRLNEMDELQRLLKLASAAMLAIIGPMLLVLIVFGQQLVVLMFGEVYAGAWLPLVLLCAAQLALGIFGMGPILLAMVGRERYLTRIYLVAVACALVAAAVAIPRYGAVGAAMAQIVSFGLIGIGSARFARQHLKLQTTFFARTALPAA